ncbi:UvrD-helicase domain-containing protein [Candidatus Daviesbacteria bacterium]|nr:UvrD-helicase domain-containing protein [Candidatus Daviesbacteria bacterium]
MNPLLEDLNPVQKQSVEATEGPCLILAGAGSGKTKVLTHKAAYLIQSKKIPAENILLVTFTNKAAGEMKARIIKLLGDKNTYPVMGTFHSFCARILRTEGKAIGLLPSFTIYDEADSLDAVKQAMEQLNLAPKKTSPYLVKNTISGAKNEMITSLEYPQFARGYFQETVAKIYLKYQEILEKNQAVDFDDLLLLTVKLWQNHPQVLLKYQQQFRYILIDEYQDTNAVQYLLAKMLTQRHQNICVVGDASQAIYGFRGADFRNIVNFQKDYPNAKVFNLEQNYRSTQTILDAAHAVISQNKSHPILKLWTDNPTGAKIETVEAPSEIAEANLIVDKINQLKGHLSDYAVLYRTNAQSRVLEEVLIKAGMPYILVGGTRFYERKEIKDVLSYLRLVVNPIDSVSLKRIEKLGKGRLARFFELAEEFSGNTEGPAKSELKEVVGAVEPSQEEEALEDSGAKQTHNEPSGRASGTSEPDEPGSEKKLNHSTLDLLDRILEKTGYLEYLDDGTEIGKGRIENVKELRSVAELHPDLVEFLETVALVEREYPQGERSKRAKNSTAVTLSTIHQAKGLEWPMVFMVGMEEGLFPHSQSLLDPAELEEERRLAYVGITRAKNLLVLSYCRQRLLYGTKSNNLVSRFLIDIPQSLVKNLSPFGGSDMYLDDVTVDPNPVGVEKDDDDWLNI